MVGRCDSVEHSGRKWFGECECCKIEGPHSSEGALLKAAYLVVVLMVFSFV